jgi:hypothetical protein
MVADFEKTKDAKLPAVDQAAISAAGYTIDDKGWLIPTKKRLSIHTVKEDKDSPLSSGLSDLEDEGADNSASNRKPGLRLDEGNLSKKASPNTDDSRARGSIDVDTPVTGQTLTEDSTANKYKTNKENNNNNKANDEDTNESQRPTKKRKRETRRY